MIAESINSGRQIDVVKGMVLGAIGEPPHRVGFADQQVEAVVLGSTRLQARYPQIVGPKADDICYATSNRQAAVKRIAPDAEVSDGLLDVVIANILAGPLVELAPDFARAVIPGGSVLLAGLLDSQEAAIRSAYFRAGFRLAARLQVGDWPVLWFRRRTAR